MLPNTNVRVKTWTTTLLMSIFVGTIIGNLCAAQGSEEIVDTFTSNNVIITIVKYTNPNPTISSINNPTIIFTHGLLEEIDSNVSTWNILKDANLNVGYKNILLIKWELINNSSSSSKYRRLNLGHNNLNTFSQQIISTVGSKIMEFITKLQVSNSQVSFHLIGQNIGAHIMGHVGYLIEKEFNVNIDRITGLDPCNTNSIIFGYLKDSALILDSSDAKFVDVIHTDVDGLGSVNSFGHVDFFINGGLGYKQNGCSFKDLPPLFSELVTIGCAHQRSSALWIYTVSKQYSNKQIELFGCPCKKVTIKGPDKKKYCKPLSRNICDEGERIKFGQLVPFTVRGNYYVHVSNETVEEINIPWFQAVQKQELED